MLVFYKLPKIIHFFTHEIAFLDLNHNLLFIVIVFLLIIHIVV